MTAKSQMVSSRSGLTDAELHHLIQSNESLFRMLSNASILITGATGWFGVWLLDVLCMADDTWQLGLKIEAVSRDPARFLKKFKRFSVDPRIQWVKTNVRQFQASRSYSHIIHAAADTSVGEGSDAALKLFDSILDGTRRIIDVARTECKSVLLLSSGAVYGPAIAGKSSFLETDSGGPDPSVIKSAYAEGKRSAELLGAIASTMGVPVRIARCFAFVGPHMPFDKHFAIGNFIADAVHRRPIRIKSDGRPLRSYLYMTDLIRALLSILLAGTNGRPYNVGSDVAVTIEQLAHLVDRVVGGRGVVIDGAVSDSADRYVPDITRLKKELDFNPEISLEAAITRTAAWYRARVGESMAL